MPAKTLFSQPMTATVRDLIPPRGPGDPESMHALRVQAAVGACNPVEQMLALQIIGAHFAAIACFASAHAP